MKKKHGKHKSKTKNKRMENTTTIEKTVQKAGRTLGVIRLNRDERTGHALLYLKTDIKSEPLRGSGAMMFAGAQCHKARQNELLVNKGELRVMFNIECPGQVQIPFYNSLPIVQPLLAKANLAEGVTFDFGSVPLPASQWREYMQALKHTLCFLYSSYYQPLNMEIELTSVERLTAEPANIPEPEAVTAPEPVNA